MTRYNVLCFLMSKVPKITKESSFIVVKHIFRYLIGTSSLGLCFNKREDFRLISYCDVDCHTLISSRDYHLMIF